ncbi:MAG: (E)-4-hydroxy-3-methylbut-2-enyl-diphosphate synthase [Verrucomicrobia bacterium]|nr:(E)-4-hydroxy-3-methylbut-2-enyl-diphosphate synthase [Verrucomicrobiota bacterium]
MKYCESVYCYQKRFTREVTVGDVSNGGVIIGGDHPVVRQSMLTSDTKDTAACVEQTLELVAVGCQIVRITAPNVKSAANLEQIVDELRRRGCLVPIVADIHFLPSAAMEAVKWVEKIRVNPGNYADKKKFATREYTDEEYDEELTRIEEEFTPLVLLCKELGRALRIGTNHGSLSDRIMNRYGDSPLGMVESALEFARIARKNDFHNFVFSMKSSNPKVMIACYRLLVARLNELGPDWNYPIHLGVTEAGDGEDGRIKSAIGIGSLLCDGLGETIRVSLTEDSPNEIRVCNDLLAQIPDLVNVVDVPCGVAPSWDPFAYNRRQSDEVQLMESIRCGGDQPIRVIMTEAGYDKVSPRIRPGADVRPEGIYEQMGVIEVDPRGDFVVGGPGLVSVSDGVDLPVIPAFRLLVSKMAEKNYHNPILLKDTLKPVDSPMPSEIALLRAAVNLGSLICDGIGDAILIRGELGAGRSLTLGFNILQAAGSRSFKTDYVACPSCGRTLFNLQEVTARIKARTVHLKGVKIAIMGCIVNGPGEMADADFGYVGGAPGKINLYVGKTPVEFNIPESEAVDRLVGLIRQHGKWVDPGPSDNVADSESVLTS